MARIKIDFSAIELSFSTRIPVLIQHVNYGGHLSNDAVLALAHEARIRYLQHLGGNELDAFGTALIMTDAVIAYRGEGFQGDLLKISMGSGEFTTRSFGLFYRMECERKERTVRIADVKTGMLCFNYEVRKPAIMPELLREKLTKGL